MNFLSFCLSGNVYSSSFLKDSFSIIEFLVDSFSFRALNTSSHCLFIFIVFDKKSTRILLRILCMWRVASVSLLLRFSLSFGFDTCTVVCLSVDFFEFILLGVCWISWMRIFMSFIRLGCFQLLFLWMFFLPPLSSSSVTPTICMLLYLTLSHVSLRLYSFSFILFSFCSSDWIISIAASSR